jgi:hypothetical protein
VFQGCHLEGQRDCGKGGIEISVREVVVGDNMHVAATESPPVTIYASRFLVVWRNIPRIVRNSQ